jgi:hypothetical protein
MARSAVVSAMVATAVTAAAFLSNPDLDAHRAEIRTAVEKQSRLADLLGLGVLKGLVVDYHSAGVVSWTTNADGVVSVGGFGMVFVPERSQ